jgi:hypothetical protein
MHEPAVALLDHAMARSPGGRDIITEEHAAEYDRLGARWVDSVWPLGRHG